MNEAGGSRGLGGDVEHDEEDDRPRNDLLQHPITSQRALSTSGARCARRVVTSVIPSIAQGNLLTNDDQPKFDHSGSAAGPGVAAPIVHRWAWRCPLRAALAALATSGADTLPVRSLVLG